MARNLSRPQARGIAAAVIVSLVGAGFSARAGLERSELRDVGALAPERKGFEADDHFPGAAYFHLADDEFAAPAAGTTGTVDLPDLPMDGGDTVDPTIHAAAPFVFRGTEQDRARALQCLTTAIYYEAASESDDGQRAVAQVILNRVRHPTFPATVCGVIYQGSEKSGCQFSYACDGSMARKPNATQWQRAGRNARAALAGYVYAPVGMATHYHTHAVTPSWNKSLVMTGVVGAHFFHRWKGRWGTPAAFSQGYHGGEPFPGPRQAIAALTTTGITAPAVPLPGTSEALAAAGVIPAAAPAANTKPRPVPVEEMKSGDVLPKYSDQAEDQILDRWKDSGKPIR